MKRLEKQKSVLQHSLKTLSTERTKTESSLLKMIREKDSEIASLRFERDRLLVGTSCVVCVALLSSLLMRQKKL